MNALTGAEAKVAAAQKERQNNFPMISSKPKEQLFFYQRKSRGQGGNNPSHPCFARLTECSRKNRKIPAGFYIGRTED
jgi:hypothetical protein